MSTGHAVAPDRRGGDQASRLRDLVQALRATDDPESGSQAGAGARAPRPGEHTPGPEPSCPCPVLCVTSGKGGVGKTCIAAGLAAVLADMGRRVTLLDADPGMANADVLCGVSPKRRLDLARASRDDVPGVAIDLDWGFRLVPGAVGGAQSRGGSEQSVDDSFAVAAEVLAGAGAQRDLVIADTGGGLGPAVTDFIVRSDLTLVVTTPEPTAIADAYALIKTVMGGSRTMPTADMAARLALLVNEAGGQQEAWATHARIERVAERFLGIGIDCAGWMVRDPAASRSVRRRRPLPVESPEAPASRGLRDVARWVDEHPNIRFRARPASAAAQAQAPMPG